LGCNSKQERISFGIKQLKDKSFKKNLYKLVSGFKISCTVNNISKEFLDVEIEFGMKGVIRRNDISSDKKEQRTDKFNIGDVFEVFVVSFDNKTGKLILTIKDIKDVAVEEEEFNVDQYMTDGSTSTLGNILSEALELVSINSNKK
jgi:small subunit ribosomal protein S1